MADMNAEIDAALADWIADGQIVADKREGKFNDRTVITKSGDSYSLFRAFPVGDKIAVSVDQDSITADAMMAVLLAGDY